MTVCMCVYEYSFISFVHVKLMLAFAAFEYLCAICGKHIFKYTKAYEKKNKRSYYLQAKDPSCSRHIPFFFVWNRWCSTSF